jgi:hypothetical protein
VKRVRLREAHSAERLAELYAVAHDHRRWPDHEVRVAATIALMTGIHAGLVADLSCGNGTIAMALGNEHAVILGDVAVMLVEVGGGWCGPIEETIGSIPLVDTFVLSETLEHLDDPGVVLAKIRAKARRLLLTTPIDNWDDPNEEHYWAWDREGVEDLAMRARWRSIERFAALDCRQMGGYLTGMWVLS